MLDIANVGLSMNGFAPPIQVVGHELEHVHILLHGLGVEVANRPEIGRECQADAELGAKAGTQVFDKRNELLGVGPSGKFPILKHIVSVFL